MTIVTREVLLSLLQENEYVYGGSGECTTYQCPVCEHDGPHSGDADQHPHYDGCRLAVALGYA